MRLRVWRGVGDTLSAERRQRLFVAIAAKPTAKTVKADELLIVDVGEARKRLANGLLGVKRRMDGRGRPLHLCKSGLAALQFRAHSIPSQCDGTARALMRKAKSEPRQRRGDVLQGELGLGDPA